MSYELHRAVINVVARWPVAGIVLAKQGTTLPKYAGGVDRLIALNVGVNLPRGVLIVPVEDDGFWIKGLSFSGRIAPDVWVPFDNIVSVSNAPIGEKPTQVVTFPLSEIHLVAPEGKPDGDDRPKLTVIKGGKS